MTSDIDSKIESSDTSLHAHSPNYFAVFIVLCCLTAASVVADFLKMENMAFVIGIIAFLIAAVKASYVLLYFMHLKFEGGWKYIILLPTTLLAIGVPLAIMPDIAIHYYTIDHSRSPLEEHVPALEPIKPGESILIHPELGKPRKFPPSPG